MTRPQDLAARIAKYRRDFKTQGHCHSCELGAAIDRAGRELGEGGFDWLAGLAECPRCRAVRVTREPAPYAPGPAHWTDREPGMDDE